MMRVEDPMVWVRAVSAEEQVHSSPVEAQDRSSPLQERTWKQAQAQAQAQVQEQVQVQVHVQVQAQDQEQIQE
jgi:hypothetical protein